MEKSHLWINQEVAVYVATPVPTDPYARTFRSAVRRAWVVSLETPGQVAVRYDEHLEGSDSVTPRQVIATWPDWLARLEERDATSVSQSARVARRVDDEAAALSAARQITAAARIENHCVVIPVEDFLGSGFVTAGTPSHQES